MIEENDQTAADAAETPTDAGESAGGGPQAAEESAEGGPQAAEPQPEAEETPAEDAPAEEAPAEEAPAEEAPAAAAEPAAPVEPEEVLHPKERRRRSRSAHAGETRPQRGPEERAAEREARRSRLSASRRTYRQKQREKRSATPRPDVPQQEAKEHGSGRPRVRQGVVVSAKPDKTITVRIDTARRHRTYKKIVRSSATLHAHDERNEAHEGDTVRVVETRPLSRTKRWRLVEILERAR
jgi:small subunit ribosomal protein S17